MQLDKVLFNAENIAECICPRCPVQIKSACSKGKKEANEKAAKARAAKTPKPKGVPQLYCSGGKAACGDLDFKQICICGSCPVWTRHGLAKGNPAFYFCRDGKAVE